MTETLSQENSSIFTRHLQCARHWGNNAKKKQPKSLPVWRSHPVEITYSFIQYRARHSAGLRPVYHVYRALLPSLFHLIPVTTWRDRKFGGHYSILQVNQVGSCAGNQDSLLSAGIP